MKSKLPLPADINVVKLELIRIKIILEDPNMMILVTSGQDS